MITCIYFCKIQIVVISLHFTHRFIWFHIVESLTCPCKKLIQGDDWVSLKPFMFYKNCSIKCYLEIRLLYIEKIRKYIRTYEDCIKIWSVVTYIFKSCAFKFPAPIALQQILVVYLRCQYLASEWEINMSKAIDPPTNCEIQSVIRVTFIKFGALSRINCLTSCIPGFRCFMTMYGRTPLIKYNLS